MSKDVLRRRWIVSGVTKPWTVANFGNTLAMTIFFFWKMFEIWWRFHKWNKNSRKFFLFLRELDLNRERQILTIRNRILVISSPCVNKNPLISNFDQGDIFQIISLHCDQKYGKSALLNILLVFRTVKHVDCRRVFWDGAE